MDLSHVVWVGGPDDGPRAAVAAAAAARAGVPLHHVSDIRASLVELRALDADGAVAEGDMEPKSVAAVLHRPGQAVFVGDAGRDVAILRLDALSAELPLEELVAEVAQRLRR